VLIATQNHIGNPRRNAGPLAFRQVAAVRVVASRSDRALSAARRSNSLARASGVIASILFSLIKPLFVAALAAQPPPLACP